MARKRRGSQDDSREGKIAPLGEAGQLKGGTRYVAGVRSTAATRCQFMPGGEQIGRGGATAATLHAGAYNGGVVVVPVEDQRDSRFILVKAVRGTRSNRFWWLRCRPTSAMSSAAP